MLTTKNWRAHLVVPTLLLLLAAGPTGCTPSGPRALLDGERLLGEGKWGPAISKLTKATQLLPGNAQAWNHLGLAYHRAGQSAAALKAYEQARNCDPNLIPVRFNLGCLLLEQNNPQAAVGELTSFTLLQRESVEGWLKLGTAQLRSHQWDGAERSFQTVLQLRPGLPEALNGLGTLLVQRRRPKEALNYFTQALQKQPNYPPALLNVAILHHQYFNNRPLALQKYQDYLELDPTPRDAAAVQEIVRQLRAQAAAPARRDANNSVTSLPTLPGGLVLDLGPAPRPPTNASRPLPAVAITNPPSLAHERIKPSLTNTAPPAVQIASAEPKLEIPRKVEVSAVPAAHVANLPAKEVVLPSEVVELADAPVPKLPQDTAPAPARDSVAAGNRSDEGAAIAPKPEDIVRVQPSPEKHRAVERLNPATWFRPKREVRRGVTPIDPLPAESTPSVKRANLAMAAAPTPASAPAAADSVRVKPALFGRRYAYQSPARPVPGDRRQAESVFAHAVQLHRDGRLSEAIENYRQTVRMDPSFFEAQFNLGLAAYELKDLPQSLSAYETALAINPSSSNARYNFAIALEQGRYFQDAADQLEKLIEQHPGEARAHFSVASLYAEKLARPDLARPHYRRVLELEPQHAQASAIRFWLAANP